MVQAALAASVAVSTLVGLHFCLDTDYFFVVSVIAYSIGLLLLVYKLTTHKNCSGLSLRTQEVSAIFLVARVICAAVSELEVDLHIILDSVSLLSASWVIYKMRYKLQSTYIKELDNMRVYYLVVPCCVLALLVNPGSGLSGFPSLTSVLWAFCTYLESVSVLPQLRLIQNAKMVEPFTAHYVFALGVARFLGFGHWVLMIYETGGKSIVRMARLWYLWLPMNMLAEIVQTFILADFCYYYIISVIRGKKMVLPSPV
uniref:ER lumen protein-retaining receptor n=1 Tax=Kalanchoe fedtschenkoi TaxID=63787 RepID=A0A7N0VE13_KALFE